MRRGPCPLLGSRTPGLPAPRLPAVAAARGSDETRLVTGTRGKMMRRQDRPSLMDRNQHSGESNIPVTPGPRVTLSVRERPATEPKRGERSG